MTEPVQLWQFSLPALVLGAYYFARAARVSRYVALAFVTTVLYALGLEVLEIRRTHAYFYNEMLVMIGAWPEWFPLAVAVSWASIVFLAMRTSDLLGLPWGQRPLVDGLIGVSIDLVLDPVASATRWVPAFGVSCVDTGGPTVGGLGLWTWCLPTGDRALWFEVPLSNFVGWYLIVAGLSFGIRAGRHWLHAERRGWLGQLGILAAAAVGASVLLFVVLGVYSRFLMGLGTQRAIFAAILIGPLALLLAQRRRLHLRHPPDVGLLLLPLVYTGLSLWGFARLRLAGATPGGGILMLAAALASLALLVLPYVGSRDSEAPVADGTAP